MTNDDAAMMLFGVRYCLGRNSYAPGLCCDWLRAKWPSVRQSDRDVILRDIRREIDGADFPGVVAPWQLFLAWAERDALSRREYERLVRAAKV